MCLFPYLSLILLTVVDKSNINFLSVCSLHCPGQELFPYLLCISAQLVELVVDGFFFTLLKALECKIDWFVASLWLGFILLL